MSNPQTEPQGSACPVCGGDVPPQPGSGQPRRYCSSRCKSQAARQRRADRDLSPTPTALQASGTWDVAERVRITRALSKRVAIEQVAADPNALNAALIKAKTLLASPTYRATSWREVATTITALAAMIGDDKV